MRCQIKILTGVLLFIAVLSSCKDKGILNVSILSTTDIHGVILPYDFTDSKPLDASLAHASGFFKEARSKKDVVFLLDNGDNLQGQPSVYYYNYIDTISPHFISEVFNWLEYDAVTAGNHDIEAGHSVYDRLLSEYDFPVLAANAVDTESGKPYFKPYVILERKGVRIAVMGLITPAIPGWLPENSYSGIIFKDMVESAKMWMPEILKEDTDLVVGLFHSGWNKENTGQNPFDENGSAAVAYNVPGFDIIFTGHDHRLVNEPFINKDGGVISQRPQWADCGLRSQISGKVETEPLRQLFDRKQDRFLSDAALLSCVAMRDAIQLAELTDQQVQDPRTGVIFGSGAGASVPDTVALSERLKKRGGSKVGAYQVPLIMGSSATANAGVIFGIRGHSYSVTSACSTSAPRPDAGPGSDPQRPAGPGLCRRRGRRECLQRGGLRRDERAVQRLQRPARRASRPLDQDRDGFVFSGGAGVLVLEDMRIAVARGARSGRSSRGRRPPRTATTWSFPTARAPSPPWNWRCGTRESNVRGSTTSICTARPRPSETSGKSNPSAPSSAPPFLRFPPPSP